MAQIMTVVQKRGIRPVIVSSKKKMSNSQIISILSIRENNPKVIILKGRVIVFMIGLMKELNIPKIPPTKIRICQKAVS